MEKISVFILVLSLTCALLFSFTACNNLIVDPNDPDFNFMDVVHNIYDKSSTKAQTIKSVNQLAILTSINYTVDNEGPIGITPAKLNNEDITLIVLGGTEDVEGQATTIRESQLASFGKDNDYLTALSNLFLDGTIPKEKPIMIVGISLGGMIAQQILSQYNAIEDFNIKYVVTFGSPFTVPLDRDITKVVRFVDSNDLVPKLGEGVTSILGIKQSELNDLNKKEVITKTSKYTKMPDVHALSYVEDECWKDLDFLGMPYGTNTLVTLESLTYYHAPILS